MTPGLTRSPQEKSEWCVPGQTPILSRFLSFTGAVRYQESGSRVQQTPRESQLSLWEKETIEPFLESRLGARQAQDYVLTEPQLL